MAVLAFGPESGVVWMAGDAICIVEVIQTAASGDLAGRIESMKTGFAVTRFANSFGNDMPICIIAKIGRDFGDGLPSSNV